jgi:hypothetical protein
MPFVIRRKTPNCRGDRYFGKPAPVQHHVRHARKFETAAEADAERSDLREPWLWEVMTEEEAARLDAPPSAKPPAALARRCPPAFAALAGAMMTSFSGMTSGPMPIVLPRRHS